MQNPSEAGRTAGPRLRLAATRAGMAIGLLFAFAVVAGGQDGVATVTVRALSDDGPVVDARVAAGNIEALTDRRGEASLRLPAGDHTIRVERLGLRPETRAIRLRPATDTTVVLRMEALAFETEAIIVTSTRLDRRIEDEPVRVEVIGREEVEEKLLMTPGDIAMLLNETAGLRVQPTASALGGAGVRIHGLRGRYTQILSDGLPLHGGQAGALGPLQIPPMDLGQVEVIKGAASALYGASALGGVVNLISRRPGDEPEPELLFNQSTRGGSDAIAWDSRPLGETWSYTLLAGAHRHARADIDDDGWSDMPAYRRVTARPRLFWNGGRGRTALLTIGGMAEDREGGALPDRTPPVATDYREGLDTRRLDGGAVVRLLLDDTRLLTVRGSATFQRHTHRYGTTLDRDAHRTAFAEAALSGTAGAHAWVAGVALHRDAYRAHDLDGYDYTYTVPGIFAQDEYSPAGWITIAASGRLDAHDEYGTFLNPRISLLLHPASEWTVRTSAGSGYFAPTPWTDETEAIGLRRLVPPSGLEAERARTASIDVARTIGDLELNATVFGSRIRNALQARRADTPDGRIVLFNADDEVRTRGTELLARYHREGLHITATHVYTRSTEPDPLAGSRREVALTPRHTAGLVAALEDEDRGRVAVEFYYTGEQSLEDNPYRAASKPHVIVGMLVERRVGRARLFLNAENIFDTRQTRYDPLLLPARSPEGRWTTDVWAPLEGRAFNGGLRWEF